MTYNSDRRETHATFKYFPRGSSATSRYAIMTDNENAQPDKYLTNRDNRRCGYIREHSAL
jgi:hypothetical protein